MKYLSNCFLVCLGVLLLGFTAAGTAVAQADRVLVVYNANTVADQDGDGTNDSRQVAEYYAAKRGVPAANVLGLSITGGYVYTTDYARCQSEVIQPIKAKLTTLGPTSIDVILLCYGVPSLVANSSGTQVSLDNALMGLNYWNSTTDNISWSTNPYRATKPTFEADKPHFTHASYRFNSTEMYLVARIDGKSANAAMNLVDMALYGERYIYAGDGYYNGNVYVDSRYAAYTDAVLTNDAEVRSGAFSSYDQVDKNIAVSEHYVIGTGLNCLWEQSGSTIGSFGTTFTNGVSAATAPRTLFYSGWYGGSSRPFEWLAGSIGCHLHSMSFAGSSSWDSGALELGAAGVGGTVGEPYTTGHQRPNVMLYYILNGYSFAEASMLSTPSIGWMPLNVGDPLYAPMKAKTPVIDTQAPAVAAGYPTVTGNLTSGTRTVNVWLEDTPEPEMARILVEYGFTTAYGLTASNGAGYCRIAAINLTGLQGNSTYHYRLRITDPVGNVLTTGDNTFTTGVVPNTAPTVQNQSVISGYNAAKNITLNGTDAQGNALFFSKVDGPAKGAVTISGATATYTPDLGYSGSDSFTFKASDGALDSNTGTVSITVMPTTEVTVTLQQGLNGYTGAKDATISGYGGESTLNWGGSTVLAMYSVGSRSAALAFDLSASIPIGATISGAELEIFATYGSTDLPTYVYRMTRSWVEGTKSGSGTPDGVTHGTYDGTNNWTTGGGDFDPVAVAQMVSGETGSRWLSWNIRDLVQLWVSTPTTNHGVLLRNGLYVDTSLISKEYSTVIYRPKLTVSYFPSAVPSVIIASPADNVYVTNSTISLSGNALDDNAIVSVMVNGTPATTSNGYTNWTCAGMSLLPGSNTLQAIASDGGGLASTATVHIVAATDYSVLGADGVPILWKIQNWGSGFSGNANSGADADPDTDGMNNDAEYFAGTSPTNALSRLELTAQAFTNAPDYVVEWMAVPGKVYKVYYSSTLTNWFSALEVTNVAASVLRWTDDGSLTGGAPDGAIGRFYRIKVQ